MPSTQSTTNIAFHPHSPSPHHMPSTQSITITTCLAHTVHHKYQVPSIQPLPPKPSSVTCIIQWECMPLQDILQGTVLGGTRACAQVQRTQPILQYKQNWSNNSMFFKNKTVMPNIDLLRILVCWQEETANYTLNFTHTLHVFLFLCVLFMTFC